MRRSFTAVLGALALTVAAVLAGPPTASAEPGDLDGTFGGCGLAAVKVLPSYQDLAGPGELFRQPSGKLVQEFVMPGAVMELFRYNIDGSVDQTFGNRGAAPSRIFTFATRHSIFTAPNGRIYGVGLSEASAGGVSALTSDGAPDTTFGHGGLLRIADGIIWSAAMQSDGRLIIARASNYVVHIERLNLDGNTDPTFTAIDPALVRDTSSIDVDTNDDVVVTTLQYDGERRTPTLLRFDRDGNAKSSATLTDPPPSDGLTDPRFPTITLSPDGTILVTRVRQALSSGAARSYVSRFLPNGSLDLSFGAGGRISARSGTSSEITNTLILPDGSIALLIARHMSYQVPDRILVQFRHADGTLDTARTGPPLVVADSGLVRASGIVSTPDSVAVGLSGAIASGTYAATTQFSLQPLERGAGLVLQWDGGAFPTRWGTDPGPECPFDGPHWPDDDNARGITTVAGQGGYEVDLFGGIHPFAIGRQRPRPSAPVGAPYWLGWDIARGIAAKPDGTGGYTLDAYGGIHPFHTGANAQPPATSGSPYWIGADITRGIALMPDGKRGYVLDLFGGIHRFTTPGHRLPPRVVGAPYWPGFDIARSISILDDGTGGYTVDGYGGIHPFALGNHTPPLPPTPSQAVPYLPGNDWVRGFAFIPPKTATVASTGSLRGATGSTGATTTLDALLTRTCHTPGRTPGRHAAP